MRIDFLVSAYVSDGVNEIFHELEENEAVVALGNHKVVLNGFVSLEELLKSLLKLLGNNLEDLEVL